MLYSLWTFKHLHISVVKVKPVLNEWLAYFLYPIYFGPSFFLVFLNTLVLEICWNWVRIGEMLTHWGWDKMAAILQKSFSNSFSHLKIVFNFKFQICSQGSSELLAIIGSNNGLSPTRRQAIIWTNDDLVYWCIDASLGLNESIANSGSLLHVY